MNDFSKLAVVCSQFYENLNSEEKSPNKGNLLDTKKLKSQNALDFTCVDDIQNLSSKTLVEKFSESTSDELKRRYSYKCAILPDECDTIFESYGSEKKACDKMRQHLQVHLQILKDRIRAGVWPPKRENTEENVSHSVNCSPKATKKIFKSQHLSGIKIPSKRKERSQPKKKQIKSSIFQSALKNKIVNGFHSSSNYKLYSISVSGMQRNASKLNSQGYLFDATDNTVKETILEEIVQENMLEICGPLCTHVNCSLSQPSTSKAEQCVKLEVVEEKISDCLYSHENLLALAVSLEHSYAALNGVKVEMPQPEAKDIPPRRRRGCCIPEQLIIRTPSFPFVHVPLLPECAFVEEIGLEYALEDTSGDGIDYSSDTRETNNETYQDEEVSPVKIKRITKKQRKQAISSSVLECVENRVDINSSSMRVPNSPSLSPEHSFENSENLQKAEKERALKYISKLKSKKKKQYQGPLECRICEHKKFTALATLIHHYRSHAGIKPYSCKLCDNTFTRKHSLNYHMLIHKNQSRFTCPTCFREFRHPSHFKEHLRRHTGETPYTCETCELSFKTRNTFKRHMKIQHKKLLTKKGTVDILPVKLEYEEELDEPIMDLEVSM